MIVVPPRPREGHGFDPRVVRRFRRRFTPGAGCWVWTGTLNTNRYGAICVDRRPWLAHRLSYHLFVGPIPDGRLVCHHCDNRPCVRPDHLFLGTALDNVRDMIAKGRRVTPPGKLTSGQVVEVRARHAAGSASCDDLAAEFGVTRLAIMNIVNRMSWKHLR